MRLGTVASVLACCSLLAGPATSPAQGPPSDADKVAAQARQWDVDAAIKRLRSSAKEHSTGWCAKFTANAIDAGGLHINRVDSAKDFGPSLVRAGFREYSAKDVTEYKKGDVVVIQGLKADPAKGIKTDHLDGHMAMYDGRNWISDFKQKDLYGGPIRNDGPSYKIYRYHPTPSSNTVATPAPKSDLGGVLIDPTAKKDNKPLSPGQGDKVLEKRPDGSSVKWTIKLPKEKPQNEKDK